MVNNDRKYEAEFKPELDDLPLDKLANLYTGAAQAELDIKLTPMTALEIIDETEKFYTEDPSRRAVIGGGLCRYETEDGRHCAVGRCMIPGSRVRPMVSPESDMRCMIPGSRVRPMVSPESDMRRVNCVANCVANLEDILRPQYRGHSADFWSCLQQLHDNPSYWNEEGLTPAGRLAFDAARKETT